MTKTQELKIFNYNGITHIGNVRKENEDTFEQIESVNGSVFVICDGMGGVKGGKQAAEKALGEIKQFISEEWYDNPKDLLTESITRANIAVYNLFPNDQKKPGTTVVMALVRENKIWYAHAGDSRLYYFTGKKLFQITKDHSYVAELLEKNLISEEESYNHPRKNEITKALGTSHFIDPTICKYPIEPSDEDFLLLCSDGLVNEISNKEISEVLIENGTLGHKTERLINKALENGGTDNITVQLLQFYNTGKAQNISFTFKDKKDKKTGKYKIITLFFAFIILLSIAFLVNEFVKSDDVVKEQTTYKSHLNVKINDNKDTLAEIFVLSQYSPEQVSDQFNTDLREIGYVSGRNDSQFSKYYIPVKNICIFGIGNSMVMHPEVSNERMIDLIIVNNKNELFFSPGEIFLIPKE
jgi:serine/threonine protein phosphatase PrpC